MNEHEYPGMTTNGLSWRAEVFLEDSSGCRADEDDAEFSRERGARAWITAILDSLRWNGRKLGRGRVVLLRGTADRAPRTAPRRYRLPVRPVRTDRMGRDRSPP